MTSRTVRKGTYCEVLCQAKLIADGYDVFTPVAGQGPIDIVAVHPDTGEVRLIDVKALGRRSDGSRIHRCTKGPQKKIGVEIIEVDINERADF